ncbi:MAG: efflux RND transporter periplasmic adaptor subunit [Prevotellaceae bacterium]|jgi:RND family efflux transporter MFP subunit|nr:efflux RND transporter periplasmic adaptor subunit [Prevotellaceae bacterium]
MKTMKTTMRSVILSGTGVFLSCLPLASCNRGGAKSAAPAQDSAAVAVAVVEVKAEVAHLRSVEQIGEYTGTISPYSKNMIASQSSMRIDKILVEVGDYVATGQLLVQMEPTSYLQAKLQAENLKVDYERAKALFATGGVSKQQLDQLKTQLDVSEESLANLNKNTRLLSPINGVVTQRMFDNGDMTGGQPILQVQQLRPVKILINVQEEFFSLVNTRMTADIKVDIYAGTKFTGQVNLVYPTIDNMTHTFTTEIAYANGDLKMRPGMFARVVLNFGSISRVVLPDKAVIKQPGTDERFVYVLNADNTVSHRTVKLGQRLGNAYEILSGVEDGEKVVTAGISRLINGSAVREVAGLPDGK